MNSLEAALDALSEAVVAPKTDEKLHRGEQRDVPVGKVARLFRSEKDRHLRQPI